MDGPAAVVPEPLRTPRRMHAGGILIEALRSLREMGDPAHHRHRRRRRRGQRPRPHLRHHRPGARRRHRPRRWYTTSWSLDGNALHLRTGLLSRNEKVIPRERISVARHDPGPAAARVRRARAARADARRRPPRGDRAARRARAATRRRCAARSGTPPRPRRHPTPGCASRRATLARRRAHRPAARRAPPHRRRHRRRGAGRHRQRVAPDVRRPSRHRSASGCSSGRASSSSRGCCRSRARS